MTSTTQCGSHNTGRDIPPAGGTAKERKAVAEAGDGDGQGSVVGHGARGRRRGRGIRPRSPGGCDPGDRDDDVCGETDHEGAEPKAPRDGTTREPDAGGVRVARAWRSSTLAPARMDISLDTHPLRSDTG